MHFAHVKSSKDNFVEGTFGPTGQETVKFDKEHEVGILRSGGGSVPLFDMVVYDVDTL